MHTHVPLHGKRVQALLCRLHWRKDRIFHGSTAYCLVTAAERNGRTYIAVTMRDTDLGINCTDSTALFDYAFNNFDSIEVDGKAMTVPKGVTAADLTMESKQKGKKTLNQYYYQGQFVGYVTVKDTPAPEPAQGRNRCWLQRSQKQKAHRRQLRQIRADTNDITASEHKSVDEQIREMRTEGISDDRKNLLIAIGGDGSDLIGL